MEIGNGKRGSGSRYGATEIREKRRVDFCAISRKLRLISTFGIATTEHQSDLPSKRSRFLLEEQKFWHVN